MKRERHEERDLVWPAWATWALVATILTGILTIVATFNDINYITLF
jgi:hypothetical protein